VVVEAVAVSKLVGQVVAQVQQQALGLLGHLLKGLRVAIKLVVVVELLVVAVLELLVLMSQVIILEEQVGLVYPAT
jgi:hypothetical protein